MATIKSTFGSGGAGVHPGTTTPSLATVLRDIADDLIMIRTWGNTLATKLNADTGVADTNYAQLSALVTIKG